MKIVNNLFVGAIAFVVLISIALITIKKPEHPYELSQQETLDMILNSKNMEVVPEEIPNLLENTSTKVYFVDLRSPGEFIKGHIAGAINIPQNMILEEDNLNFFRSFNSDGTVVLYGKDQVQANGPWMILKQLGINNIEVLEGGYNYYIAHMNDLQNNSTTPPEYMIEVPQYDFKQIMAQTPGSGDVSTESEKPKEIVPVRRKKNQVVAGGC